MPSVGQIAWNAIGETLAFFDWLGYGPSGSTEERCGVVTARLLPVANTDNGTVDLRLAQWSRVDGGLSPGRPYDDAAGRPGRATRPGDA
jgi:hypothetical protein